MVLQELGQGQPQERFLAQVLQRRRAGAGAGGQTASSARHPLDVAHHVVERRVVREQEVLVHGQREARPDVGHDLGLLDRVNAKFTLKVLVHFDEVSRVAGVLHDDRHHGVHEVTCIGRGTAAAGAGVGEGAEVAAGAASTVAARAGSGAGAGWSTAASAAGAGVPPCMRVKYASMWLSVGWSESTKSSSTGSENRSRSAAMISACLTVSMPNSPSNLIHLDELCRIACVFDDHFNHSSSDLLVADVHGGRGCRSGGGCGLGSRLRCRLGSRRGFRFLDHAFEGSAWTPCLALHAAVEVALPVDIRDQGVVLDAQHDVVRARKTSVPCQHGSTVYALTLDRPASHQREGDL